MYDPKKSCKLYSVHVFDAHSIRSIKKNRVHVLNFENLIRVQSVSETCKVV